LSFLISILVSCAGKLATHEFESYILKKNTSIDFKFDSDEEGNHNLILEVRSIFGIIQPNLILELDLIQPDGKVLTIKKELTFDKNTLNCSGDFCDQQLTLISDLKFQKGIYSMSVKPLNCSNDVYGIMEFRLIQK
jgi:hypothetical protein